MNNGITNEQLDDLIANLRLTEKGHLLMPDFLTYCALLELKDLRKPTFIQNLRAWWAK